MDVCSHFKLGYDRFSSYLTQVVRRISFNHLEISASLWGVVCPFFGSSVWSPLEFWSYILILPILLPVWEEWGGGGAQNRGQPQDLWALAVVPL